VFDCGDLVGYFKSGIEDCLISFLQESALEDLRGLHAEKIVSVNAADNPVLLINPL